MSDYTDFNPRFVRVDPAPAAQSQNDTYTSFFAVNWADFLDLHQMHLGALTLVAIILLRSLGNLLSPRRKPSKPYIVTRRAGCRWKRAPGRRKTSVVRFICLECGVDAFSQSATPPVTCQRFRRATQL